ncbi:MAG: HEAT repeat domain-containing protein [Planctomycetota bacterium]|jgi:hypothetical protein
MYMGNLNSGMCINNCIRLLIVILLISLSLQAGGILFFSSEEDFISKNDPWRYGYVADSWETIESIQQYPLINTKEPDWEALSVSGDPFIRTAVALAIGRAKNPELIPILEPLLSDAFSLTRTSAFWALVQMRHPATNGLLESFLSEWDEGIIFHNYELGIGKYYDLHYPLKEKKSWEQIISAQQRTKGYFPNNGNQLSFSLRKSVWNSGLKGDEQIIAHWIKDNGSGKIIAHAHKTPVEYKNDDIDAVSGSTVYVKSNLVEVDSTGKTLASELLKERQYKSDLYPGVYLYEVLSDKPDNIFLIRVQRSKEVEKKIPKVLKGEFDKEALELLGNYKVRAAVPRLIETIEENSEKFTDEDNQLYLSALVGIGDPRVIPVLLNNTCGCHWHEDSPWYFTSWGLIGILERFGSVAYPYCVEQVLKWREILNSDDHRSIHVLEDCLQFAGERAQGELNDVFLSLAWKLTEDLFGQEKGRCQDGCLHLGMLADSIEVVERYHPEEVAEIIWKLRDHPLLKDCLLRRVQGNEEFKKALRRIASGDDSKLAELLEMLNFFENLRNR